MKRKLLKTGCLAAIILGGLELLGNLVGWVVAKYVTAAAFRGEFSGVGVIGGADGPTAVFVTTAGLSHWLIPLALLAVGLLGLYGLKKCNK